MCAYSSAWHTDTETTVVSGLLHTVLLLLLLPLQYYSYHFAALLKYQLAQACYNMAFHSCATNLGVFAPFLIVWWPQRLQVITAVVTQGGRVPKNQTSTYSSQQQRSSLHVDRETQPSRRRVCVMGSGRSTALSAQPSLDTQLSQQGGTFWAVCNLHAALDAAKSESARRCERVSEELRPQNGNQPQLGVIGAH